MSKSKKYIYQWPGTSLNGSRYTFLIMISRLVRWGWNKQSINTLFPDSCSPQITLIGNPEYGRSDLKEIYILTIMSKKVTSSLQDKQCINDFIFSAIVRIELLLTVVPFLQFENSRKNLWVQQHKIYSHSNFILTESQFL